MKPIRRDYYEVLRVARDASAEDIKRAYRMVARELHPDRNPGDREAEEAFKEASEAYTVLSDSDKRSRYDRFGHKAFRPGSAGGFDPTDFRAVAEVLEGLFGELLGPKKKPRQGDDIELGVKVSFEEAALGAEKALRYSRPEPCQNCDASGAAPGTTPKTCAACAGRGQVRASKGLFASPRPCTVCGATGIRIDARCPSCSGGGRLRRDHELVARIPPGVRNGAVKTVRGAGAFGQGGWGDLHITIEVEPHPLFMREGADVRCTVPVSYSQATLGAEIEIPTLTGKVKMKLPRGTPSGRVLRLRGQGVATLGGVGKGDQLVEVLIEVPATVNDRQRALLEQLEHETDETSHPKRTSFARRLQSRNE